jgi:hypothetical protein
MNKDNINPSHYKNGKVEAIDAIESATVNKKGLEAVCVANVIKYLWRYEDKNGIEDIKKAQWYINKLITHYNENIRENHQSNEGSTHISERGKQDQEGREESALQEQLRKSIEHFGRGNARVKFVWLDNDSTPG